ncbi:MAG: hypothetical protein M3Y07_16420 [Acidobacteriota bacterium]|nr:hypothetical protein [Acidobacteriota bacterium]
MKIAGALSPFCVAAAMAQTKTVVAVDPDTPAETEDPKYIGPSEIYAIEQWVKNGGRPALRELP